MLEHAPHAQAQAERIFGVAATFDDVEPLLAACRAVRAEGFCRVEAYTPFPVEDLTEALGHKKSLVPLIGLLGAIFGGTAAFGMEWFANVIHYPLNVGGKPPNSWPAFIPITFEWSVLGASFGAVFGMLALCKLPQPYHPLFDAPSFRRASRDRFVLCIEAADPMFERGYVRKLLTSLDAVAITEVPLR